MKGIVHLRLTCSSRRQKQAQKWHLDSSACQRWGWLQRRIRWGSSSQRHHKSYILKPIFRHFWNERLVSTYKVPNLWERRVFPLTDTWSGARTGLDALPLDPQRRAEAGLCLRWPTDSEIKLGGEFGFDLREAVNFITSAPLKNTTWVSHFGLVASVQVGQPRFRTGPIGATLWTKQFRAK